MTSPPIDDDRQRWNRRHADSGPSPCDPLLLELLARLPARRPGRAADLACGSGRHALELARCGYRTCGVDLSDVALRALRARAAAEALPMDTVLADLAAPLPFAAPAFELVVVVNYLERALLPRLAALVRRGGHLLYVTFTQEWPGEKPSARFRLATGELARGVPGFTTLHACERGGRAALLAARDPRHA